MSSKGRKEKEGEEGYTNQTPDDASLDDWCQRTLSQRTAWTGEIPGADGHRRSSTQMEALAIRAAQDEQRSHTLWLVDCEICWLTEEREHAKDPVLHPIEK